MPAGSELAHHGDRPNKGNIDSRSETDSRLSQEANAPQSQRSDRLGKTYHTAREFCITVASLCAGLEALDNYAVTHPDSLPFPALARAGSALIFTPTALYQGFEAVDAFRHQDPQRGFVDLASSSVCAIGAIDSLSKLGVFARAGGAFGTFVGISRWWDGVVKHDKIMQVDGGTQTALGLGAMLAAEATGWWSNAPLVGWCLGRLIGQHKWGGSQTIDQRVTSWMDHLINKDANTALKKATEGYHDFFPPQVPSRYNQSPEPVRQKYVESYGLSKAILCLREDIERDNKRGDTARAKNEMESVKLLIAYRSRLLSRPKG